MTKKEKPSRSEALAGRTTNEGRESLSLHEKLEKYSKAKQRQGVILNYLKDISTGRTKSPAVGVIDYQKTHSQISSCFNYLVFNDYYTVGETRLVKATSCKKHLLCAPCAIRRAAKSVRAYLERFEAIIASQSDLEPYHVVLTVKNGQSLEERFKHLQKAMKAILKSRRNNSSRGDSFNEFCKMQGGVYSYELTRSEKGWHPHIHMIALVPKSNPIVFDKYKAKESQLSKDWHRITGDSFIVYSEPLYGHVVDSFCEVFKYALKFSDMTPENVVEAFGHLRGKRLQGSFGSFRGVEVPSDMNEETLEDLPYMELIYQWLNNRFSLQSHRMIDAEIGEGTRLREGATFESGDHGSERLRERCTEHQ